MSRTIFKLLSFFLLLSTLSFAQNENGRAQNTVTKIVMLGTGTPNADPERFGPAVAIVVNDTPYLVDCGVGIVRRAAAAHRNGVKGLAVKKLNTLFLTHLHSDHTLGLPDLIFTPWVLERNSPLQIYGPPGTAEMTNHILKAYEQDISQRIHGLEPANESGHRVINHLIESGIFYRDSLVTVEAFPVKHGGWDHAFGFKFITPDRTIVISGDTVPLDIMVEKARGCDVLIHEVYSHAKFLKREKVWQNYHASAHTSTYHLAEIAAEAKPGLVILYHQLFWGATAEELLAEIREKYDGAVVSGVDLGIY